MGFLQKTRAYIDERRRSIAEAYLSSHLPAAGHRFLNMFGVKVGDLLQKDSRAIVPEIESKYGEFWEPPYDAFGLQRVYERHWVVNACISKLVRESTRQGYEWEPNFEVRCLKCESEYDFLPLSEACPECSGELEKPDPEELVRVTAFCNRPNPTLTIPDILKRAVRDLLIFDDFYVSVALAGSSPQSVIRTLPETTSTTSVPVYYELWPEDVRYIQVIADKKGRLGGKTFCPLEETPVLYDIDRYAVGAACPKEDGGIMMEAAYVQNLAQQTKAAWSVDEMIHTNLYAVGSRHYGTPKLLSVQTQVDGMQLIDVYQKDIFDKAKTPKNIFIAKGFSEESLVRQLRMHEEKKKLNPMTDMWLAAPSPAQGTNQVGIEKILGIETPLMQGAMEHQDYLFKSICYTFGVSPASIGVETSGKLGASQEGTEQRDVTPETINEIQIQVAEPFDRFFKRYFPEIRSWTFRLKSAHEGEDIDKWNLKKTQMETAKISVDAGFEVVIDEDGTPKISGAGKRQETPSPFGAGAGPDKDSMDKKPDIEKGDSRDRRINEAAESYRTVLDAISKDAYAAIHRAIADVLDAQTPDNRATPEVKIALIERIERALNPVLAEAETAAMASAQNLIRLGAQAAEAEVVDMGLKKQEPVPPREFRVRSVEAMRNTLYFGDKNSYLQIIRDLTDKGIEENWTTDQLARELRNALDPEKEHFPDFMWERIARTEAASYVIEGERQKYQEFGVPKLKRFVASDATDDLCAPFAGAIYRTEAAYDVIPAHPNCRCSFAPYFGPEEPL